MPLDVYPECWSDRDLNERSPLGEPSPIELTGRLTKVFEIEKLLQAVDRKAKGTEILSSTLKWDLPPRKRLLFQ